jgi:hypothetical protein
MRLFVKQVTLLMLRAYKWAISPIFLPACRYVPSCSDYAMEAVERYGAARGGFMALMRLLRCHPFARGGHDPVPQGLKASIAAGDLSQRLKRCATQNQSRTCQNRGGI